MFDGARTIVIFGDSYSVSSNGASNNTEMSWVYHLKAEHLKDNVTVHNFSMAGATTEDDLEVQIARYLSTPSKPWTSFPKAICYVFFLGINDCGTTEECLLSEIVEKIPEAADRLYTEVGARNFVFINVPPTDRSPGGLPHAEIMKTRIETWNEEMRTHISQFVDDTPTARVSCFSSHDILSAILDDPEKYGFTEADVVADRGGIWVDELHLTSRVHKIIAERMKKGSGV
ncbi:hypothetical protein E1B28_013704 [Marasmius oreades]|uniref:Uncharacterized protein n=1 Tax=Marasmius oreades TaxID=181124 RepID=A0A9P7RRJ6_9AGAR|nr:uncharacterized protein E1B28_013704 [Marasmius oreades]KAG7087763.1 hypothetical protein E1B28_013704 [Marasmius oreades]